MQAYVRCFYVNASVQLRNRNSFFTQKNKSKGEYRWFKVSQNLYSSFFFLYFIPFHMTSYSIRPLTASQSTPVSTQSKIDKSSLPHTGRHKSSDDVIPPPLPPLPQPGIPRLNVLREPRLHQTFEYKAPLDGKLKSHRVGYAEYGSSQGHPVFIIGGYGCTRLVGIMFEELAYRYGLRTIWPERPG